MDAGDNKRFLLMSGDDSLAEDRREGDLSDLRTYCRERYDGSSIDEV